MPSTSMASMVLRKKRCTASSSARAESRSAMSSRCSSLSTTCRVAKEMSVRCLPIPPESVLRRVDRIMVLSSSLISPRDWSNWEMISRFSLT